MRKGSIHPVASAATADDGHAGARLGDRMRRGTLAVCGDTGDFAASRMVSGTLLIGGRPGAHIGYGMRRGTVVCSGAAPQLPATFVANATAADVFWQLLARDLAALAPQWADLPQRRLQRHWGDVSARGQGELWCDRSPAER